MNNTRGRTRKSDVRSLRLGSGALGAGAMDSDDNPRPAWRERLPYAIGVLGLIAWFALLYFMLRDVA